VRIEEEEEVMADLEKRRERLFDRLVRRHYSGALIDALRGAEINWLAGLHDDATFAASLDDIEQEIRRR
jgi:hypothetical protein